MFISCFLLLFHPISTFFLPWKLLFTMRIDIVTYWISSRYLSLRSYKSHQSQFWDFFRTSTKSDLKSSTFCCRRWWCWRIESTLSHSSQEFHSRLVSLLNAIIKFITVLLPFNVAIVKWNFCGHFINLSFNCVCISKVSMIFSFFPPCGSRSRDKSIKMEIFYFSVE